jgi:outer membrane protein OmpA-like peptidoglycan-associated protein
VLDAVAATMIGNPDILLLEVQGHTDSRNTAEYNLKLSQDRAEAVRDYLIKKGVEQERLTAKGYGESAPIEPCDDRLQCTGKCEKPCSNNRRVEFIIRKRSGG